MKPLASGCRPPMGAPPDNGREGRETKGHTQIQLEGED